MHYRSYFTLGYGLETNTIQHLLSPHAVSASRPAPHGINAVVHSLWYISINQATDTAQGLLATFVTLTFRLMVHSMGSPFPTLYSGGNPLGTIKSRCFIQGLKPCTKMAMRSAIFLSLQVWDGTKLDSYFFKHILPELVYPQNKPAYYLWRVILYLAKDPPLIADNFGNWYQK